MQKNTVWFVVCSVVFITLWYWFFTPQQQTQVSNEQSSQVSQKSVQQQSQNNDFEKEKLTITQSRQEVEEQKKISEQEIIVEKENYKAVFSNKGAGIKHWYLKEKNGTYVDLIQPQAEPVMANFPGSVYEITKNTKDEIVFSYTYRKDWKIIKTYKLSDNYLHNLDIKLEKLSQDVQLPAVDLNFGPGLGTDDKEQKENVSVTRVLGLTSTRPSKLEKIKTEINPGQLYKWVAMDNRYFLFAFIPSNSLNFSNVAVVKQNKRMPPLMSLSASVKDEVSQEFSLRFYAGAKSYVYLKGLGLGLEKTVDFGFFSFLGRWMLSILFAVYGLTNNYGWAIIIITICIQILVLPLTMKSFKSMAAMKTVQPMIKNLQEKYKNDPKRLQVEMMNLYRTQKVNPLGGCLPMLLQLPIFWAMFTTLRNAYELRFAEWIFWVKDLSASDSLMQIGSISLNVLPLIMGIGMFLQQRMTTAVSDPAQRKMMYIMPIIFTVIFWGFPSGLVIYWLTNSICSIIVQFFILRNNAKNTSANGGKNAGIRSSR